MRIPPAAEYSTVAATAVPAYQPSGNPEQYLAGDRCALDLDRQGGDGAHRHCEGGQSPRPTLAEACRHQVRHRQTVVAPDKRHHSLSHSPALEGAGKRCRKDDPEASGAHRGEVAGPAYEYEGRKPGRGAADAGEHAATSAASAFFR